MFPPDRIAADRRRGAATYDEASARTLECYALVLKLRAL